MTNELQTAIVKVWSGEARASYDSILAEDPDEYELEIVGEDTYYVPHEDHAVLAENIEHHGTYALAVEADEPVELVVQTSDHYHDTIDGFEQGRPVEGGLLYGPDRDAEPFQCEMWGAIRMRVEVRN